MQNMLLISLLAGLYGCQPQTPAQQPAVPAAVESPAAQPADSVSAVAAAKAEPAPANKTEQVVEKKEPKVAVDEKAARVAPAQTVAATAVKSEVAPVVATPKPAASAEAVLSETDALRLAQQSGCLVCHTIGGKVVGPAWKDVAAKYRGDAGAEAMLIAKVAKGGKGVWGGVSMPPNSPRVSDANIKSLVRFVLSLK